METFSGKLNTPGTFVPPSNNKTRPLQSTSPSFDLFFPNHNAEFDSPFSSKQKGFSGQFLYPQEDEKTSISFFKEKRSETKPRPAFTNISQRFESPGNTFDWNQKEEIKYPQSAFKSSQQALHQKYRDNFDKAYSAENTLSTKSQPFMIPNDRVDPIFPIGLGNVQRSLQRQIPFPNSQENKYHSASLSANNSFSENLSQSTAVSSFSLSFPNSGVFLPEQVQSQIKNEESKKASGASNAEIMKSITDTQINCVSILNEVASKVKKRVDYQIKEVPMGKIKVFECTCVFEQEKVGFGKGNSKQGAKTDAAIDGVNTLLTKEEFTFERAHLILSVQKITGIGTNNSGALQASNNLSKQIPEPEQKISSVRGENDSIESITKIKNNSMVSQNDSESLLLNDSALYELNIIAKECEIEPLWEMSSAGGPNGDFKAFLKFDTLFATGEGRKKLEAKRDAAFKIIQQIRGNKELNEKYSPKQPKKKTEEKTEKIEKIEKPEEIVEVSQETSTSLPAKIDRSRLLFESCFQLKAKQEMQNNTQNWKESITKPEKSFNEFLTKALSEWELSYEILEKLQEFYKQITDCSIMTTSNPKQYNEDAAKHLADYVTDFHLVPLGSFALDCMRNNSLSINALAIYNETKKMSEKEFLELYCESLKECYRIRQINNPSSFSEMEIKVVSHDIGNIIEIIADSSIGKLSMQIQFTKGEEKCHISMAHIKKIYDCFDNYEKLKELRAAMSVMRAWRAKNNLWLLSPELIDAVLITSVLNNKAGSPAGHVISCILTMSMEETFKAVLDKCGSEYIQLYKDIPSKTKWNISAKCTSSLEAIYQEDFIKANI